MEKGQGHKWGHYICMQMGRNTDSKGHLGAVRKKAQKMLKKVNRMLKQDHGIIA